MAGNTKIVDDVINALNLVNLSDTGRKKFKTVLTNALRRARRDERFKVFGKLPETKGKAIIPIGGARYVCKPVSEVTGKRKRKKK